MRFFLLLAFCALSLNTSAQFWKKKVRYAQLEAPRSAVMPHFNISGPRIPKISYATIACPLVFDFDMAERAMLKEAKRNMRYRVYQQASSNFSDLASLYLLHNRFSEAKWYLLQSNALTHDVKLNLANLLTLAGIKTNLGDVLLARTDLQEARVLANANGLKADIAEIDKRLIALNTNKPLSVRPELRYSADVEAAANRKTASLK